MNHSIFRYKYILHGTAAGASISYVMHTLTFIRPLTELPSGRVVYLLLSKSLLLSLYPLTPPSTCLISSILMVHHTL